MSMHQSPSNGPREGLAEAGLRPLIRNLETDNIADLATKANAMGDVVRLWYGEGDIVTPPFIREAAAASMNAGDTFYVPDMRGRAELVAALARYQTTLHGRPIGEDRSTVTPGGMQAVHLAMMLVCDPGQNVVYVEPQWPNIRHAITLAGGRPIAVGLDMTVHRPRLDLDRLFAACDESTAAICFSSPCNPTGWTASADELAAILDFARARGIWVISDEVYNRLWFGNEAAAPSMMRLAEPEDRVLTVNSFSKAWAMTGWRVGWLGHPPSIQPVLSAVTQYVNSGTAAFVQAGAAAALKEGEPLVAEIRERCRSGLDAAYEILSEIPSVHLPEKPLGGIYAFFRLEGEDDSRAACRRILEEAKVGLAPGFMFGEAARPFLRMCVFRDTGTVREAAGRIAAALR
ncbi:pyridoxal phosphate-dependent aminotransferase [Acuticoccus sp. M5D2P5]|uniref:pyridoxal phosphate-dependent aminotransferase n=1 Tax=Acuticoccus kalidii TaxID=2910977 RepID=UPI001F435FB7|nr:pyridoxal phosphate-dependent aminotransferase [Acuticoccus kalidii]MCF3932852.1 pyridoxal phosphate-dependent aminotransferase [Acuticoccus kalidii]